MKTFAHFQQWRIARWSWHHPCGNDLLKAAGFQSNTDHDKEDLMSMRLLLFINNSQCVVIDTSEDLPSISDIQISYLKLRSLCSADASTPTPDEKWLSNLEGTRWLDYASSFLLLGTVGVLSLIAEHESARLIFLVSAILKGVESQSQAVWWRIVQVWFEKMVCLFEFNHWKIHSNLWTGSWIFFQQYFVFTG